jgi:hypothetical protein
MALRSTAVAAASAARWPTPGNFSGTAYSVNIMQTFTSVARAGGVEVCRKLMPVLEKAVGNAADKEQQCFAVSAPPAASMAYTKVSISGKSTCSRDFLSSKLLSYFSSGAIEKQAFARDARRYTCIFLSPIDTFRLLRHMEPAHTLQIEKS